MEEKKKCEVLKKLQKVIVLRGLGQSGWEQEGILKAKGNQPSPTMTQAYRNTKRDSPASHFQPPSLCPTSQGDPHPQHCLVVLLHVSQHTVLGKANSEVPGLLNSPSEEIAAVSPRNLLPS